MKTYTNGRQSIQFAELDRQERTKQKRRCVSLQRSRIRTTAGDLIDPKITARLIRLAVKEVYILLPHHVRKVTSIGLATLPVRDKHITQRQIIDCFTQITLHSGEIPLSCSLARMARSDKRRLQCTVDPRRCWVNVSVSVQNRVRLLDLGYKLGKRCCH